MERFQKEGNLGTFNDNETLELLLDMARCPGNRKELTDILLDRFGSIRSVLEAREEQLMQIDGIGTRTASMIRLILPFFRIWERSMMQESDRIANTKDAEYFCKSLLAGLRNEHFYVVCMTANCKVLGHRKISEGSLSEVSAYPRIVMETALNYNAHSILLTHNHPGGTNSPSSEDIASTLQIQRLLHGVGIMVLDHIIVAGDSTYSMVQHGDIDYRVQYR